MRVHHQDQMRGEEEFVALNPERRGCSGTGAASMEAAASERDEMADDLPESVAAGKQDERGAFGKPEGVEEVKRLAFDDHEIVPIAGVGLGEEIGWTKVPDGTDRILHR